jgi:hypothetical protein
MEEFEYTMELEKQLDNVSKEIKEYRDMLKRLLKEKHVPHTSIELLLQRWEK